MSAALASDPVKCVRCGAEVIRAKARVERWGRGRDGWVCPDHTPIDWPFAGDQCSEAVEMLHDVTCMLFAKDPKALERLEEVDRKLTELREAMAPLREQP